MEKKQKRKKENRGKQVSAGFQMWGIRPTFSYSSLLSSFLLFLSFPRRSSRILWYLLAIDIYRNLIILNLYLMDGEPWRSAIFRGKHHPMNSNTSGKPWITRRGTLLICSWLPFRIVYWIRTLLCLLPVLLGLAYLRNIILPFGWWTWTNRYDITFVCQNPWIVTSWFSRIPLPYSGSRQGEI